MRPAAGKRIADEPSTRVSWPLFCIVFLLLKFHATHPKALACCFLYVVTFRSQGFNLIACPNIPVCLKRGVVHFECRDTGQRICQVIWNRALSWFSTPAPSLPSPDLQWGRRGGGGENRLYLATQTFLKWLREWGRLTGTDGTRLELCDAVLHCARASQAWLIECDETVTEQGEQQRDRRDGGREVGWPGKRDREK